MPASPRAFRVLLAILIWCAWFGVRPAPAADDTARFYGTWKTSFPYNGQTVTIISVHDQDGYKNYLVTPTGNQPFGDGTFSASNGRWSSSAPAPNDGGTYHFISADTVLCTNSAGQTVTWRREKSAPPPLSSPAANPSPSPAPAPVSPQPQTAGYQPDPSVSPEINTAFKALTDKDYNTAWRIFMAAAQHGASDGEAGVGMMLFNHQNPPGTGYYAQCEKWLLASANQGNVHGMYFLAQYYNEAGRNTANGINPGVNTNVSPYERAEAEKKFALARTWFERAADKGDAYAKANLAIMLDAGVGGPRDPQRAAKLRAEADKGLDPNYKKRALEDPSHQAMLMAWQSGHYADALKTAEENAAKGDAASEGLLAKASYEGVGVKRDFHQAMYWANKANAQNDPEGTFILGLIYKNGAGVPEDRDRALKLFDQAGESGHRYAQMEAKAMRMDIEIGKMLPKHGNVEDVACNTAGGTSVGFECIRGGENIDPFASWQNESN
jgi:TPR repeat protein